MEVIDKEYEEFVNQILGIRRFGKKKGIEVSGELLDAFERPEKNMKIIHIAGTNGKGSVACFTANALMRLGFKVGLFTSPHLIDFNERIQVGCGDTFTRISHEEVIELGNEILDKEIESEPTMFDICFVMAILKFKNEACDYVVLETGLGGKCDSTTSISCVPRACVITSIGLDHTKHLGDSLESVAENKAGIIVPGSKIIISDIPREADDVMRDKCKTLGIPDSDIVYASDGDYSKYYAIKKFSGYQRINAKAAITTVKQVIKADRDGFFIKYMEYCKSKEEHCSNDCAKCVSADKSCEISFDEWEDFYINRGIAETHWEGRLEKFSENVLIDGAHNEEAFDALCMVLKNDYSEYNISVIMGVLSDKDYKEAITVMKPIVASYYTADIDDVRGKSGKELADEIAEMGYSATYIGNEKNTAEFILDLVKKNNANSPRELYNDLYVLCGSLYFVGNVKRYIWQLQQE